MNRGLILSALLLACCRLNAATLEWLTDVPTALARAKAENKAVLLDFTGSDWCIWCRRLKNEVFDQPEFVAYAQQKLILVEVDFPDKKPQSSELRAANKALAERFGVKGYPTIIALDGDGKELLQDGYQKGGPRNYISRLDRRLKSFGTTVPAPETPVAAPAPSQPWRPIAEAPRPVFSDWTLKAIVGTGSRRIALINDQTFAAGEKGFMRMETGKVGIVCKEIRDDSVLILVAGESNPRELKLKKK
jgi:protein disulfide-isomerase